MLILPIRRDNVLVGQIATCGWNILKSFYRALTFSSAEAIILPHRIIWSLYTGRWLLTDGLLHLVQRAEGLGGAAGRGRRTPRPLLAVPNVTAHPSTASVPNQQSLYCCIMVRCSVVLMCLSKGQMVGSIVSYTALKSVDPHLSTLSPYVHSFATAHTVHVNNNL